MADGFLNFLDMIDGGGAGASGNEFQGGGLLSDIANSLFQPAGYRERMRGMQETRPMARPANMMPPPPVASPASNPITPMMRNEDLAMSMPVAPASSPMGSGMTPANAYVPTMPPQQYDSSGMTPANAYEPMSWSDMLQMMVEQQRMQQFGRGGPRY